MMEKIEIKKEKGMEVANAISKVLESYDCEDSMNCILGLASVTVHYLSQTKEATKSNTEDGVERIFLDMLKTGDNTCDTNFREYINTDGLHKVRDEIMLDTVVRVMGLIRRGVINASTKNIDIMRMLNKTNEKAS